MARQPTFTVSEFVVVLNQTLEYAYPVVSITGEIANFRISKNRWVYFDLKDEAATVRFFGTVYQLPGPLEDGMAVTVRGTPQLHQLYGFSVTVQSITPTGEGSIKKAAALLEAKLKVEGLFDESRKRLLPYPPEHIGLITSGESAAYRDFTKVVRARWGGLRMTHADVQVQGSLAVEQIVAAVEQLNRMAEPPEVLVITRGGGSAEDLQAFSTEQVTRAVASSRVPTLVAIGHEVDISLAELAADQRASTPSNAAELLVPDRRAVLQQLQNRRDQLTYAVEHTLQLAHTEITTHGDVLYRNAKRALTQAHQKVRLQQQVLHAYDPQAALSRGYAVVRKGETLVREAAEVEIGDVLAVRLASGELTAIVKKVILDK